MYRFLGLLAATVLAATSALAQLAAPSVSLPDGWMHGLRNQQYSFRAEVRNNSSVPRTLCFSSRRAPGLSGDPNNVTTGDPTVPPCQGFGAGETRTFTSSFTMANSDWDGDGILMFFTAYDQESPSLSGEAWTKVSVQMDATAPAPASLESGKAYRYFFRFYNRDRFGTTHTYNVTPISSGVVGVHGYPPSITIAAGTWGEVYVDFTVREAGQTGTLMVQLQDPNWVDRLGKATATITSVGAPPPVANKFDAYSIYASNLDPQWNKGIPVWYAGLDARQYRQYVGWQGCTPDPNGGDPVIGYRGDVQSFAKANPGRLYIFLDEPGHGTWWSPTGCKQVTPAQYARAYHRFVTWVSDPVHGDPTAKFSPAGPPQYLVQHRDYNGDGVLDPSGHHPAVYVDYMREFWAAYTALTSSPRVDEWRFHVYWDTWRFGWDFANVGGWTSMIDEAITFAGQTGRPLVMGIGYPWEGETQQASMLTGMTRIMCYLRSQPSVVGSFWWSYDEWHDGNNRLTTLSGEPGSPDRTLTALGVRYRDVISGAVQCQ